MTPITVSAHRSGMDFYASHRNEHGITSKTAAQHLVVIQPGFSKHTVVFEQDATTVTRKPKRRAAPVELAVQPTASGDKQQRAVVVVFSQPSLTVMFEGPDEMTVARRTDRFTVTNRADEQVVRRKPKRT